MLRLRKSKLLPQQVSDLGAFIFVVAMIPVSLELAHFRKIFVYFLMYQVTYLWEVIVVSPALFPEQEQVTKCYHDSTLGSRNNGTIQLLFPQALGWALHMAFGLLVVVNIAGNFAGLKKLAKTMNKQIV